MFIKMLKLEKCLSQKNVRLCSIPNLQIVMEAKECSYQSKARLNIVKSLGAYNYMEHLENLTILDEQSDITLEES